MRLIGLAVALALTLVASDGEAQPVPIRRIGFLNPASPESMSPMLQAFRQGLRDQGWIEGQSLAIEYRWAHGDAQRIQALAADLVQLKVDVIFTTGTFKVADVPQYENALRLSQKDGRGAIMVLPSPVFSTQRRQLIELAARYRVPAIYEFKEFVQDGGLMSYGPNMTRMFRSAASYVDRILKGARPGDLPIERPATFELAINLKTAKTLNLTISPSVLGRADAVIE